MTRVHCNRDSSRSDRESRPRMIIFLSHLIVVSVCVACPTTGVMRFDVLKLVHKHLTHLCWFGLCRFDEIHGP